MCSLAKADEASFIRHACCIIPDALQQTMANVHGEVGKRWLNQFPNLLKSLVKQWRFKIEKRCANLSFNFVALVVLEDGSKAVLKCGVPNAEFTTEIDALSGEQVLLHGDLHHFNILSSRRNSWLAIDPKGVIGEREYEICALMRNPGPQLFTAMNTEQVILRRLDQIVEYTGFDRERILLWSIVNAVLTAWWCIEDKVPGKDYLLNYVQILREYI